MPSVAGTPLPKAAGTTSVEGVVEDDARAVSVTDAAVGGGDCTSAMMCRVSCVGSEDVVGNLLQSR